MYAVLVEIAAIGMAYSSTLPPSYAASAGTAGISRYPQHCNLNLYNIFKICLQEKAAQATKQKEEKKKKSKPEKQEGPRNRKPL
jgi:hypothetical protein